MVFPDIVPLKRAAAQQVRQKENAARLIALHAGIPAVISLTLTMLSFFFSRQIEGTGGLGGLGLRSVLEAAQNMLQLASVIFAAFWGFGLTAIALRWSRGEHAEWRELLAGFRHWGAVLRSTLLKSAILLALGFVAGQIASVIFCMTPFAKDMLVMMQRLMQDPAYMPTEAELWETVMTYIPFWGIALAALVIPVFYRLRMMDYVLLEQPQMGAFYALRTSIAMTRHHCRKLFRLDVSFWWFYLLELGAVAVYYGDMLMQLGGIKTGLSEEMMTLLFCAVGLVLQTALYIWRQNQVSTAYALVYQNLKPAAENA